MTFLMSYLAACASVAIWAALIDGQFMAEAKQKLSHQPEWMLRPALTLAYSAMIAIPPLGLYLLAAYTIRKWRA